MLRNRALTLFAAAAMSIAAFAAREPGSELKPGFNMFSKSQDIQLGQEAAKQVREQYQPVQNQFLQDYLKRVGARLAATPDVRESQFPFTFTLLNEKQINAFALPGGPMFVFTGLVAACDNEAQLAGVMSHEMSHVILRHGTNQASKANLISLPAALAGAVVGNGSMLGQLAQLGIGLGANSVLLKYSRDAESQADALGSHIMSEAGYNPIEMARFFEKLEASGGARGPQFFSDHPNPGNREKAIEAEIRTLPQRNYGHDTGEFEKAKSMLASLPPPPAKGPNASNGYATPNDGALGGWQQFRAQNFSVAYPGNWRAYGDRNGSMITIAPKDGLVKGGRGATQVGYGAIVSYFFPDGPADLTSATDDLIHHLHAQNPDMQLASRSSRRVRVNGSEALVTMLESSSPYGGAERDALLTVERPEGLFYMVFVAPQNQFQKLESAFQQMVDSIRFVS